MQSPSLAGVLSCGSEGLEGRGWGGLGKAAADTGTRSPRLGGQWTGAVHEGARVSASSCRERSGSPWAASRRTLGLDLAHPPLEPGNPAAQTVHQGAAEQRAEGLADGGPGGSDVPGEQESWADGPGLFIPVVLCPLLQDGTFSGQCCGGAGVTRSLSCGDSPALWRGLQMLTRLARWHRRLEPPLALRCLVGSAGTGGQVQGGRSVFTLPGGRGRGSASAQLPAKEGAVVGGESPLRWPVLGLKGSV